MTEGTYTGLDDATILERLHATHQNQDGPGEGTHDGEGDPDRPEDRDDRPDDDRPDDDGAAEGAGCAVDEPAPRGPASAGMELRTRLSTLLGRDHHPGELAGWGPIHAGLARDLATTLGGAQWRFAITDEHGQLDYCGVTRARPAGAPTAWRAAARSWSSRSLPPLCTASSVATPTRWTPGDPWSPTSPASTPAHSGPPPRTPPDDPPTPRCADTSRSVTGPASWSAAAARC